MDRLGQVIERLAAAFDDAGLLYGHGTDSAWDEAVALVLGVTGLADDANLLGASLAEADVARIEALAARRIEQRVPLPYLLGSARFAGLDFHIEPGVVIPRSPIAQLVQARFRPWWPGAAGEPAVPAIVDVCCGSGCIGIACALAFPRARVTLTDIADNALALARRNVQRHGLADRVQVLRSDLLAEVEGPFDLIVSNPPYVDAVDMASLPPEYRHEPALGLAGGQDGLDLVARLVAQAATRLRGDGLLVCEVGASAAAAHRRFPRLPLIWPDLPEGGEGVFVVGAGDLRTAA